MSKDLSIFTARFFFFSSFIIIIRIEMDAASWMMMMMMLLLQLANGCYTHTPSQLKFDHIPALMRFKNIRFNLIKQQYIQHLNKLKKIEPVRVPVLLLFSTSLKSTITIDALKCSRLFYLVSFFFSFLSFFVHHLFFILSLLSSFHLCLF